MCLDQGGRWDYAAGACEFSEGASTPEPRREVISATAREIPVCVDSAATREARIMTALATAEREARPASDAVRYTAASVADSAGGVVVQTAMRDGSLATDRFPRIMVPRQGCAIILPGDSV